MEQTQLVSASQEQNSTARFTPFPGTMGVEITGVDLRDPDLRGQWDDIRSAFIKHHLLVFRDQRLDEQAMLAFAQRFGEIETHVTKRADGEVHKGVHTITNLDAAGNPTTNPFINANYYWHTDKSYYPKASLLTMLFALELPPSGGDTQFADMTRAYAALPEDMKRRIANLRVVHSYEHVRKTITKRPLTDSERHKAPDITQPLVRTHPETGEKSLFLGMYCSHVEGMDIEEGRSLLETLLQHATAPEFVYTHRWRAGDHIVWDNRCLLHRAQANYEMDKHRRILLRCNVKGTEAVA